MLGLGYALPYLDLFRAEAERVLAILPGAFGLAPWSGAGPAGMALADETELPLQDFSIDRVLMVHALEASDHPGDMLDESWRILAGGGRLLLVVPNRRSHWAMTERTPFGSGQPYSAGQLTRMLKSHSFLPERQSRALFFLPFAFRSWLRAAPGWERIARHVLPGLNGAVVIEATKQLYGAIPAGAKRRRQALRLLPMPGHAAIARPSARIL